MPFRPSGLVRDLLKPFSAAAAVCALWGCISDGPNQTAGDYLNDGGIRLDAPLHQFTFADFPVDTMFPSEIELNHFGDTVLLVGRDGPFQATARLGYQITKAQQDSFARDSTLHLRLVTPALVINGGSFLASSTAGRDSLTLVVESFSWPDTLGNQMADSLSNYHRRVLTVPAPFSTLAAGHRTLDTARIALAGAFASSNRDSMQILALPNLRSRLAGRDSSWLVYLEISPLAGASDSGLLRFMGVGLADAFNPSLLLGSFVKGDTSKHPIPLHPYPSGSPVRYAVNYKVVHSGNTQSLLYGVSRGLHMRLNRLALLDSIYARLGRVRPAESGRFAADFFVPYARLRLPLADSLARVDGPFALDMQLISDVDSALPGHSFPDTLPVALDDSLYLLSTFAVSDAGRRNPMDSLSCHYRRHPADTALRRVIFRWRRDSLYNDTFTVIPDGKNREYVLRKLPAQARTQAVSLAPDPDRLRLQVFFGVGGVFEPRDFLDTAGNVLTSPTDLRARFWRPGASELVLRSTYGIRGLLNRRADTALAADFFLRPTERAAYDTAGYKQVNYPVLGEIDFPRRNGKVRAAVDIFLFPLGGP